MLTEINKIEKYLIILYEDTNNLTNNDFIYYNN